MIKTRLTLGTLFLLLTFTFSIAEPVIGKNCCTPMPVGGMESLAKHTSYPMWARADRINSNVVLNFRVEKDGSVSNVEVAKSGGAIFDKSAIDAVTSTKWTPAMQNGSAVAVTYELPFEYRSN